MFKKSAITIIQWLLYGVVALVPLIFVHRMMNPFIIPKITLFQAFAEIIIFLWIGLALFYKEYRPKLTPVTISFFVLFLLLTVASIFGVDLNLSLWSSEQRAVGIVALWHFFLFFLTLVSLRKEIKWRNVWFVSIFASGLVSLLTLLSFTGSFLDKLFLNQGWGRPGGTFGNPTFLAGYTVFNVFISLWFIIKEKGSKLWIKIITWVSFILGILLIFKTQTRGDIIGLFAGLLFLSFLLAIRKFKNFDLQKSIVKNVWAWILIVIFLFGGVFFFTRHMSFWEGVPGLNRLTKTSLTQGDLDFRFMAWQSGLEAFKEKPVLGYGWENFGIAFGRHYNPNLLGTTFNETNWDKPHNIFLEYLVAGGVLGLLAYLILFVFLFYELIKSKEDFYFKAIFASLILAYLVQNAVIFDTIGTYLMFFLVSAFISTRYIESYGHQQDYAPFIDENSTSSTSDQKFSPGVMGLCFLIAFVPIYFLNIRTVVATHYEYGGPNYFLNHDIPSSLESFQKSLDTPSPYWDYVVMNMVDVVRQAYGQNIAYPNLKTLVAQIDSDMQTVISHHPNHYLYYIVLADFKNTFYQLNSKYLDEAEELANKALEISPNRQQIYYTLAKTNILRQKYDVAKAMFQKSVDLNLQAGDPHFYLGLLEYQTGDSKAGDKEIAFAKKLGRGPRNVSEAVALGTILGDLEHKYSDSITYLKQALEMSKKESSYISSADIELKLALAYYFNDQLDEAKATFQDMNSQGIDFTTSPAYNDLKAIFNSLGLDY